MKIFYIFKHAENYVATSTGFQICRLNLETKIFLQRNSCVQTLAVNSENSFNKNVQVIKIKID